MNTIRNMILLFVVGLTLNACKKTEPKLEGLAFKAQLEVLFPSAEISSITVQDHFKEAYQLILKQPLDHNNLEAGTFNHYIYVSHSDYSKPTVLVTEGYSASPRTYELSQVLQSNQVMVEYRFYGKSRPEPIPWEYLKNDQAVEDYHSIVTKLKQLYKNKWISTGISKGGETALIYKSKYPNDMDVAVPYVAPLINTQEDIRTENLINTVGTKACRNKISQFQRHVLTHRDAVLKDLNAYAEKENMTFTQVPMAEALEYAVLEFPFSFWQWGGNCDDIPTEGASTNAYFEYLIKISGMGMYNDEGFNRYLPSFYQHMIELGYYKFDLEPVKDLLQVVKSPSNKRFAPSGVDLTYNPDYIKNVREFVENKGDHILYINGAYDPWGACAPTPKPHVDALKMVLEGGHHGTRIKDFSEDDQQKIYDKLREWLGDKVEVFPINASK